ncbi:DUF805 domain-containing protein [Cellulophaga baltica]|uniref:DUF805 domain-containing protein n=1 Tax=Cellulophaga TaxID=104264 RepID=UPI001C065481|nr:MULTISPECIES: DUF805 domain-containing protein [Cellulophaga]MBU2995118.1 DUF805 domain-containing protein [Cellulophaga baltica]MDO6766513.1 DUF805 domain-containing protein [Cellulophaga sp. 1_MG-2023]
MEWFLMVLKKYSEFKGRSRRKEYWMFYLFSTIISVVLSIIDGAVLGLEGFGINSIYSLGILIPTLAVGVRRMHDVGKSGWFLLIPFYNLYLLCTNGEVGPNQYGLDPKNPDSELNDIGVSEA